MIMMPKQLPNVMDDKGYQKDARDFVHIPVDTRSAFPAAY